ncbi:hypothetical protein SAMN06296386_11483 [Lachnospiraceae bacterium]|nr:hypothetical protein SAMN06296386_11483 [Lachnospiraceae bacterium]
MKNDKSLLRRCEDDLRVGGIGVIVMGCWSLIKVVLQIYPDIKMSFSKGNAEILKEIIVVAVLVVFMSLALALHFYIGINAVRSAQGETYHKGYVIGACVLWVLEILCFSEYSDMFKHMDDIDTTIASIIVDITIIFILTVVIISSFKIKKLRESEDSPNNKKIQG